MCLALAICIKPYLVLLLISPLLERDFRHFVRVVGAVASASLVGFLLLQGAWDTSIGMYLQTTGQYTTQWADFIYFWTHGMLGMLTHPVLLGTGILVNSNLDQGIPHVGTASPWYCMARAGHLGVVQESSFAATSFRTSDVARNARRAFLPGVHSNFRQLCGGCPRFVASWTPVRKFRTRMRSGSGICQCRACAVPIRGPRDQHGSLLLSPDCSGGLVGGGHRLCNVSQCADRSLGWQPAPRRRSSSPESPASRSGPERGDFNLRINRAVSAKISSWTPHSYPRDHEGGFFIALVAISMSWWALSWPTTTQDEFSLLIYPDLILNGRAPNEDFFSPYGPGAYLPLALTYAIFGNADVQLSRSVGMAYHVLLAFGVWNLTRRLGRLQGTNSRSLGWLPLRWFNANSLCMASCVRACNVVAGPRDS